MTRNFRTVVLTTGIAGGLLFAAHICIPYCGNWPFIWPVLAGAAAVWLATREPQSHRWRTGLVAGIVAGVITGAVAFVGISAVVYAVIHTGIAPGLRHSATPSAGFTAAVTAAATIATAASLSVVELVVAFLSGMVTLGARYLLVRHAQA